MAVDKISPLHNGNGCEGCTLSGPARDRQPPAMAVEHMLDQRKAKSGTAERAAASDIHAIKALGQARKMFGRDSRAMLAHRDHGLWLSGRHRRRQRDLRRACRKRRISARSRSGSANTRMSSSTVPRHDQRACRRCDRNLDAAILGQCLQRIHAAATDTRSTVSGRRCALSLDPGERQQVVDQAAHALGLRSS